MSLITELGHTGEFLLSEASGWLSRDTITVLSGQNLAMGAVVGRTGLGVGRISTPAVVGTGNGTMTAVSAGPNVEVGTYIVKLITVAANGGTFSVTSPSGQLLPNAVVATPYVSDHLNFTINDGATDFVLNDTFSPVVSSTAPTVIGPTGGAATGNGTISLVTLGPVGQTGTYRLVVTAAVTNGGVFQGFAPDGDSFGTFTMTPGAGGATAFTNPQLNFTLTDGSTDFAVGDTFLVAAYNQLAGGKVVAWDPAGVDGRQIPAGVLYDAVNATAGDTRGVIVTRNAEIRAASLTFAATVTAEQKDSAYKAMADRRLIVRP